MTQSQDRKQRRLYIIVAGGVSWVWCTNVGLSLRDGKGCIRASTEELALWGESLSFSLNYWVQWWGGMGAQTGRQRHVLMLWTPKACASGLDSLHVGEHPFFLLNSPSQVHCPLSRGSREIKAG